MKEYKLFIMLNSIFYTYELKSIYNCVYHRVFCIDRQPHNMHVYWIYLLKIISQELLLPILHEQECGSAQIELVNRAVRQNLPSHVLASLCSGFLGMSSEVYNTHIPWTNLSMIVLHTILNKRPKLQQEVVDRAIYRAEIASETEEILNSVKFCTILLSLIKHYPSNLSNHKGTLTNILSRSTCFMAKTTLKILQKI